MGSLPRAPVIGHLSHHPAQQCSPVVACTRRCSSNRRRHVAMHAHGDSSELQRREQAHRLSRLFYGRTATESGSRPSSSNGSASSGASNASGGGSSSSSTTSTSATGAAALDPTRPAAAHPSITHDTAGQRTDYDISKQTPDQSQWPDVPRHPRALGELWLETFREGAGVLHSLPLWRVQEVILPGGCQRILHVHKPHYCSMFERMFNNQEEHQIFGHLFLPAGSNNLGKPEYALESGTQAPLIGTLMEVNRAVRTMDGKLIILANSLCRFKVVRARQELPYSVADVALLHDAEAIDAMQERALDIAMRTAPEDAPIHAVMDAATAAASAGAGWQEWGWLDGYEMFGAREHGMWFEDNPREGRSAEETVELVQDVVEHGVQEVSPMIDDDKGHNAWTISVMVDRPTWAAMEAAAALSLSAPVCEDAYGWEHGKWFDILRAPASKQNGADDSVPITSLNTVAERGMTVTAASNEGIGEACTTSGDLLQLELSIWHELDTIAALAFRVRNEAVSLPLGLLQLRPPPAKATTPAAGSESGSNEKSASDVPPHLEDSPYQMAASRWALDGQRQCGAPERYPALRRALRLSYVAARALMVDESAEQRQAFLECGSIAGRLRIVLASLEKQRKVLAAIVAVKDLADV